MSDELKMMLWRSPLPQSEPIPEYWQLLYKQADFWTQQLVAVSEAVGTRRRPGRDQQIGIVLCAANSYLSPVRRWDELLLRRFNPHQTDALDHYKSHPQILLPSVNLKIIKPFLLLTTAEIGVVFFLFYNMYPSVFSLQLPVTPLPFRCGHWPFH